MVSHQFYPLQNPGQTMQIDLIQITENLHDAAAAKIRALITLIITLV